jgi:hypothetical protein
MILSFAWTLEPLMAGRKTCTRRHWSQRTMAAWQKAWDEGRRRHQAWDKLAYRGGHRRGFIDLTCRPYWEPLRDMPEEDLEAEGGLWDSLDEFIDLQGGDPDEVVAVVRFEFVGG